MRAEYLKKRNEPAYREFANGGTFADCARIMGVSSEQAAVTMRNYALGSPSVFPFRHRRELVASIEAARYHVARRLIAERLTQVCAKARDRYAKGLK